MPKNGQKQCENPDFNTPDNESGQKQSIFADWGTKLSNFVLFKDQIDRIAASLERIADVLERGIPPALVESPMPRLTDKDFSRSTNETSFEQEVLEAALKLNPDLSTDPEALGRVREFIHQRSQL